MNEVSSDFNSPFGKLKTYYQLVYYGAGILALGFIFIAAEVEVAAIIFIFIGIVLLIAALVFFYIFLYRLWRFLIPALTSAGLKPSINTPAEAIGFMFIPVFNFYWIFKAIGGLPKEIHNLARVKNIQPQISEQFGIVICILVFLSFIPFLGILISAVLLLVLHPLLLRDSVKNCENIIAAGDVHVELLSQSLHEKIFWESKKDYSELFNQKEYGINYFVGIALFVGFIISRLIRYLWMESYYDYYYYTEFNFILVGVVIDFILAGMFVLVSHTIKQSWFIPFIWGGVYIITSVLHSAIIQTTVDPMSPFLFNFELLEPIKIVTDFIFGFIFLLGLVFAVYMWGAKIWSLMIGFTVSYLIYKVFRFGIMSAGSSIEYGYESFFSGIDLMNVIARLIMASLIYLGFYLHFEKLSSNQRLIVEKVG